MGTVFDIHFYIDLIALAAAVLELYYLRHEKKFLARSVVALIVCILLLGGASYWNHAREIANIQDHIKEKLKIDARSLDDIAHSLGYTEVGRMSEALESLLSKAPSEICSDDMTLTDSDKHVATVVRMYWLRTAIRPCVH